MDWQLVAYGVVYSGFATFIIFRARQTWNLSDNLTAIPFIFFAAFTLGASPRLGVVAAMYLAMFLTPLVAAGVAAAKTAALFFRKVIVQYARILHE